jgi:hypothetical protein
MRNTIFAAWRWTAAWLLAGVGLWAQAPAVLFEDIKLYYQRPGETKFRDDKGLLALDGGQRVMMVLRENRPLLVLRYENITSAAFDEKKDKTLSLQFSGTGGAGAVRMELSGKWKQILETWQAQSGKTVEMVAKK